MLNWSTKQLWNEDECYSRQARFKNDLKMGHGSTRAVVFHETKFVRDTFQLEKTPVPTLDLCRDDSISGKERSQAENEPKS
jgi:hypothetical protein